MTLDLPVPPALRPCHTPSSSPPLANALRILCVAWFITSTGPSLAQAPAPATSGSPPNTVDGMLKQLEPKSRLTEIAPGDRDPADVDLRAKAQSEAGIEQFYKATNNAGRAAGIRQIEEAITREPRMPSAYNALFLYYVSMQRNLERAITHLESGAKHCPDSPGVHMHLGNAYSAAGRPREAIAEFSTSLKLEPGKTAQASLHYNIGNQQQKLGDLRTAIASWRAALDADERHFNARRNLVIGYYQSGSVDAARREARRLAELDAGGQLGQWAREALQRM